MPLLAPGLDPERPIRHHCMQPINFQWDQDVLRQWDWVDWGRPESLSEIPSLETAY